MGPKAAEIGPNVPKTASPDIVDIALFCRYFGMFGAACGLKWHARGRRLSPD